MEKNQLAQGKWIILSNFTNQSCKKTQDLITHIKKTKIDSGAWKGSIELFSIGNIPRNTLFDMQILDANC